MYYRGTTLVAAQCCHLISGSRLQSDIHALFHRCSLSSQASLCKDITQGYCLFQRLYFSLHMDLFYMFAGLKSRLFDDVSNSAVSKNPFRPN